jgi:alcohol dehydrogenase/propanol-preferring alcohol dehydrogenase
MKCYQVVEYGRPLELIERETPVPRGSEVLLRVTASGVCHTDVHLRQGYFDLGDGRKFHRSELHDLPITPGHEIVGEVAATGPEAEGISVGDRRVVFPWIGCGDCRFCRQGDEQLCLAGRFLGTRVDGGYADHVLVPHPRYLFDYSGIEETLACTYSCSGLTAYGALKKTAPLGGDDVLLIVGAGGLGLMATRLAGAIVDAKAAVADIDGQKRAAAAEAGAAFTIDPGEDGAKERFIEMSGGAAAAVIDFVGAPATSRFGVDVLRKGGKLVIVGLFGGAISLPLPLFPFRSMTIAGSFVGNLADMGALMDLVRGGRVAPIPVEARPLARVNETIDDLEAGRIVGRAVLVP